MFIIFFLFQSSLRYPTHADLSHNSFHVQDFQIEANSQHRPMKLQQNVLDTRELQNEANAQLQTIKLQQIMLQSRAKQWVQQQQQVSLKYTDIIDLAYNHAQTVRSFEIIYK